VYSLFECQIKIKWNATAKVIPPIGKHLFIFWSHVALIASINLSHSTNPTQYNINILSYSEMYLCTFNPLSEEVVRFLSQGRQVFLKLVTLRKGRMSIEE